MKENGYLAQKRSDIERLLCRRHVTKKNAKVKNNFSGKGMNFKHFISLRQNVLTSEP